MGLHDEYGEYFLRTRLEQLADDTARLQRRLDPESSTAYLGERIAYHVHSLFGILEPTAAELVAMTAPGDETAIAEAIRLVDERDNTLRVRLALRCP